MIIQCKNCERKFVVKDSDIPEKGRSVKCGYCSVSWHQLPVSLKSSTIKSVAKKQEDSKKSESLSVDEIKASDGKTYKFLGSQWAELLSSGKTGIFAKKKIGQELDKLTGRVKIKTLKKKQKKNRNLNPSSEIESSVKQLPDAYKEKGDLGFFGYIFLIIIILFSFVGILKTFETDLINEFPEIEYIFTLLNTQLVYVSESVKNIITITQDLINSY
jgi:predicted Zn finger-like uncharacterized protein